MREFLRQTAARPVLVWLLLAPVCLALQAFIGFHIPAYQGDSSPIFLMEAQRMLAGDVIYRDFFELTLPGTQLVYLVLFKLFGVHTWIPDVCYVMLGTGLAALGAALAKRLVGGLLALLPSALFIAYAFTAEPDPTHHWYSVTAVMGALVILIDRRTLPRLFAAGALCGVSALFTQSRGAAAVAGITVFLLWEKSAREASRAEFLRQELSLAAGALVAALPVTAYFAARAGVQRFVYCTLTFPMKYFSSWYWNSPQVYLSEVPGGAGALRLASVLIWLSVHLLVPLVYLLVVVRGRRQARARPDEPWDRLMLLGIVGLFLFFGIAFSASWLRLCSVSLPAMVLLAWFARARRPVPTFFRGAFWSTALAILIYHALATQFGGQGILDLKAGATAFGTESRYAKFNWLARHTRPGDWLYEADDTDVYFPLGLREPSPVPFLTAAPYTRPEQVRDTVEALERRRVRYVLWSVWLDVPRPRISGGWDPYFDASVLDPLRDYLRSHYHLVKTFEGDSWQEVWELNPARPQKASVDQGSRPAF